MPLFQILFNILFRFNFFLFLFISFYFKLVLGRVPRRLPALWLRPTARGAFRAAGRCQEGLLEAAKGQQGQEAG